MMAQPRLMRQTKIETSKGVPRFPDSSYIIGVNQLLNAFPNSGKVTARPMAKASYLPLNQKEIMQATAVIKLSLANPNSIRPIRIVE